MSKTLAEKVAQDIEECVSVDLKAMRFPTADALAALVRAGELIRTHTPLWAASSDWDRALSQLAAALGVKEEV